MPRRRSGATLSPWLSAKADCKEGRFLQLGNSLLLDKRYQALSTGARNLYLCMSMEAGGKAEFTFTHGTARKYGISDSSFDRWAKELRAAGFVLLVMPCNFAQYAPSVYRFIVEWRTKPAPQFGEGNA